MATKKTTFVRKSYSPETKAEALRLILEEGYTAKQVADQMGCSVNSVQNWKATEPTAKSAKKGKKSRKAKKAKRQQKDVAVTTAGAVSAKKPLVSFDEFVQGYWSECAGAMDIMRLSPDITPQAVEHINNVLRYAYNRLGGE